MSAFTVFSSDCILVNNLIDGLGWGWGGGQRGRPPQVPPQEGPGGGWEGRSG